MTRPELFARIAATTLLSKADAASAPGAVLAAIVDAISRGQTVAIPGFDRFTTWNRPARTGRHPRAGETSAIAAETVPGIQDGEGPSRCHQRILQAAHRCGLVLLCGTYGGRDDHRRPERVAISAVR